MREGTHRVGIVPARGYIKPNIERLIREEQNKKRMNKKREEEFTPCSTLSLRNLGAFSAKCASRSLTWSMLLQRTCSVSQLTVSEEAFDQARLTCREEIEVVLWERKIHASEQHTMAAAGREHAGRGAKHCAKRCRGRPPKSAMVPSSKRQLGCGPTAFRRKS